MLHVDLAALRAAYAACLRTVDPLLPEPAELPAEGALLIARAGDSVAAGVAMLDQPRPDSLNALWGALRQHRLTAARVAGPDPVAALDALLDRWNEHLAAVANPGDRECSAVINWPSRYTAPVRALVMQGFGAVVTVAAQTTTRINGGPPANGVTVRSLRNDDLDAAIPLYLQMISVDASFGMVTERPAAAGVLRELLTEVLSREATCAWIAERDGALLGLCYLDLPEHAGWAASASQLTPAAYLGCLVVDQSVRSTGIGSALAAEAHRAAHTAGAAVTLLHHAVPNPLSTPFWYRHRYRPLWTTWQRRPAIR